MQRYIPKHMNKILILSGPTHEYIDPVRFIGNASSGLMGKAIAEEAVRRGFDVEFVSGPVAPENLPNLGGKGNVHRAVSADDMLRASTPLFPSCMATVFAAAVADYTPSAPQSEKMPKSESDLILHLRPTPDIAKTLCASKRPDQVAIGFALQTSEGEANARRKLQSKHLDGIVLNTPATLGAPTGTFSFLERDADRFQHWGGIDKTDCAKNILDIIERRLAQ